MGVSSMIESLGWKSLTEPALKICSGGDLGFEYHIMAKLLETSHIIKNNEAGAWALKRGKNTG